MGRKAKYTKEQKVQACKDYLRGKKSAKQIAFKLNPTVKSLDTYVYNLVKKYKLNGPSAFDEKERNSNYSKSFKETVVKEYLLGKGSYTIFLQVQL